MGEDNIDDFIKKIGNNGENKMIITGISPKYNLIDKFIRNIPITKRLRIKEDQY